MARWIRKTSATFEDMPRRLQLREGESPERAAERWSWLEGRGLSVVGYFAWLRAQDPAAKLRPPARRKFMSAAQLAAFDAQLEEEGAPQW